ncbi:MAG: SsrA-binding protein [Planctomycetaceae bacterium]|nr:SsrA-binding protein [Planctomycetaceae bacterium]
MGKKKKQSQQEDLNSKTVCRNRKAWHNYDIIDQLECGLVLHGSEVKSIRNGKMSIDEAYARVREGELWLVGANIGEYPQATVMNHDVLRQRKLLLHKREFRKFAESATQKGLTMIPLAVYFRRGIVKVQIGLAKGKKQHDKRDKMEKAKSKADLRDAMLKRR